MQRQTVLKQVSAKYKVPAVTVFIALVYISFLAFCFGLTSAGYKTGYLTLASSHEAVLATYGDKAIVAPYNNHEVTGPRLVVHSL